MWCPAARCCRLRRVVCLCVGSHRNSHCVRTAGAGWVRRSARTLPVGRVVVYARVVVCEDYLTNTLINTQRGVSPSSLARGTRSESVKDTHPSLSRERTHTDPMCRARPALPQARNDPSCAPCAYARKHMRLLTSIAVPSTTHTARGQRVQRPSGWRCCRQSPGWRSRQRSTL